MDYSAIAQQFLGSQGGASALASMAQGSGGNSSSLKASQDSAYTVNNNSDFNVGSTLGGSNASLYLIGGVAVLAVLVLAFKK